MEGVRDKKSPLRRHSREVIGAAATKSVESLPAARQRAPEAQQLHSEQKPERIGHVLMTAEAKPDHQSDQAQLYENQRYIETINRPGLLALSETIIIDGSSLRQIYETHLIGERGLRRLVAEHLRGGNLKKVLRQEIVEHEIDFERDPALRDIGTVALPTAAAKVSNEALTALNKLLERAAASVPAADSQAENAYFNARANYEVKQHEQQQRQRRLVDILLAATAAALITAAIVVYLVRH